MTPTPSDLLSRHAPALDHAGDPALDAVLARVLTERLPRRAVSRRVALASAGVAAATVVAVAVPAVLRSGDAEAVAVERLAETAASQPSLAVPPGSFLHLVTVENPGGRPPRTAEGGGPAVYPRTLESWSAPDGTTWRHDVEVSGRQEWHRFPPSRSTAGTLDDAPSTLAALPTDEDTLLARLRPQVTGSSSNDEAVFVYLADALRVGYAPPGVQRAMIAAMARLPHVEVERTTSGTGAPCIAVAYAAPERDGRSQYVCFDEATAALVEEGNTDRDGVPTFVSVVTMREIVDEVPAEVVEKSAGSPQG